VKWRKVFLSVVLVLVVLCLSWASAVGACPPPQPPHMFWGRADEFEPGDTVEIFGEHGDLYAATEVVYSPLVWRGEAFGNVYWIDVPFDDPCTEVREGVVWEGGWFPTGECVPEQLTFKVNGQVVAKAPFGPPLVDLADVPGSTRLDLYCCWLCVRRRGWGCGSHTDRCWLARRQSGLSRARDPHWPGWEFHNLRPPGWP